MIKTHTNTELGYSINTIAKSRSELLTSSGQPIMYTSSSDFLTYDDEMYSLMLNDDHRNALYKQEIQQLAAGNVVLDIGTGSHAIWAIYAARCGAKRVYAIESMDKSYEKARRAIKTSGFAEKITLLHGMSTHVELPEKVDVCVSEILGCPGSSEAAVSVLIDAKRRFMKTNATFILGRCMTRMALCSLGEIFKNNIGICETDIKYLDRIFKISGRAFDVRVVIENFPQNWIVSSDTVLEDIKFNEQLSPSTHTHSTMKIQSDCTVDGLACWLVLFSADGNQVVDTLTEKTNWSPVFFPLFYPGLQMNRGDEVHISAKTWLNTGEINPDYTFQGNITRQGKQIHEFEFTSSYISPHFRDNPFYQTLFPE